MTGEPALAEQQRAVVELYLQSKWLKASLILEDEDLLIEYAHEKGAQAIPHDPSSSSAAPEDITSQKRTVKIGKSDHTGLGTLTGEDLRSFMSLCSI